MRALFHTLAARLREFVRPAGGDADFDHELETHLAMAEEEKVRLGMSPEEARRQARLELGGVTQLREAARAARAPVAPFGSTRPRRYGWAETRSAASSFLMEQHQ